MPRWTTSSRSSSSASSRYFPRRPTASMRAPAANGADANFGDGCPHASVIGAPGTSGSSCRRTVSTSGSSGTAAVCQRGRRIVLSRRGRRRASIDPRAVGDRAQLPPCEPPRARVGDLLRGRASDRGEGPRPRRSLGALPSAPSASGTASPSAAHGSPEPAGRRRRGTRASGCGGRSPRGWSSVPWWVTNTSASARAAHWSPGGSTDRAEVEEVTLRARGCVDAATDVDDELVARVGAHAVAIVRQRRRRLRPEVSSRRSTRTPRAPAAARSTRNGDVAGPGPQRRREAADEVERLEGAPVLRRAGARRARGTG